MMRKLFNLLFEYNIVLITRRKLSKLKRIIKSNDYSPSIEKEYIKIWSRLKMKPFRQIPTIYGHINRSISPLYVPENIYYGKIEPVLNNKAFATAYADKNFYERYFHNFSSLFPETLLRGINGLIYDKEYNLIEVPAFLNKMGLERQELIIKPAIETGGGLKVMSLISDGEYLFDGIKKLNATQFSSLLKGTYKYNFILQKRIIQDKWFESFNPSSLNTVRMYTYRSVKNDNVIVLSSVIRFGRKGSIVDNQAAGGFSCGISESGQMNNYAIDKYGNKFNSLDSIKGKSNEFVPGYEEMKKIACLLAGKYYFHRLLGFDFCLDNCGNIRLLEINCKNIEINFLQLNNGPLFGDFTYEIIDFCRASKKSLVFDFYV